MNKNNSAVFAERLLKSADSLDFALSGPGKNTENALLAFLKEDSVSATSNL
jgi:hypothetical protein